MNFDQKLNTLMNLFKINNSKLSRGINVDASLISRWKSGERKIAENSPHIPKLANYFLHLNAYHYQKEYLEQIITARLPEKERHDDASRVHVLADWLISAEPPDPQPFEQPEQLAQSMNLIINMTELLADNDQNNGKPKRAPTDSISLSGHPEAANWQPTTVPGISCAYELFEGRAGKRQAAINLINRALESATPLEIMLTSEDDNRWLTEDNEFAATWSRLLRHAADQGHRITLIHVVNRRANEILPMLKYWIPLHMSGRANSTGRISSYFYPRYGDRKIRQTLFIVKGKYAVVSSTIADSNITEPTLFYDDPATVEQSVRLFMSHLTYCRQLFAVYNRQNNQAYFEQVYDQGKKAGTFYNIRHQLNLRLLPIRLASTYLDKTPGKNNGYLLTDCLESLQLNFFGRLPQEEYIDLLPLSLLEQIQNQKHSYLDGCEIFEDNPVQVSLPDTIIWLQQTIDALQKYPNYELYLCPENHAIENLKLNITYKENYSAQFSPVAGNHLPATTIVLSENNILHSLSYYFDDFIQQIPSSLRNKADVIQRLERLINALQG